MNCNHKNMGGAILTSGKINFKIAKERLLGEGGNGAKGKGQAKAPE